MVSRSVSKSERLKNTLKRAGLYLPHGYQTAIRKRKKTTRKKTVRKKR